MGRGESTFRRNLLIECQSGNVVAGACPQSCPHVDRHGVQLANAAELHGMPLPEGDDGNGTRRGECSTM